MRTAQLRYVQDNAAISQNRRYPLRPSVIDRSCEQAAAN
jgi:hypothetical protein